MARGQTARSRLCVDVCHLVYLDPAVGGDPGEEDLIALGDDKLTTLNNHDGKTLARAE